MVFSAFLPKRVLYGTAGRGQVGKLANQAMQLRLKLEMQVVPASNEIKIFVDATIVAIKGLHIRLG